MPSSEYYFDEEMAEAFAAPQPVTCKYCGTKGLWWFPEKRDRYLLKNEDGDQHNCMRIREPASLDEFSQE